MQGHRPQGMENCTESQGPQQTVGLEEVTQGGGGE